MQDIIKNHQMYKTISMAIGILLIVLLATNAMMINKLQRYGGMDIVNPIKARMEKR